MSILVDLAKLKSGLVRDFFLHSLIRTGDQAIEEIFFCHNMCKNIFTAAIIIDDDNLIIIEINCFLNTVRTRFCPIEYQKQSVCDI